ncbi:MAG: hypothetical protein EOP81_18755 [Variovorax sp.]|nr:MAG: hypothetical protein EOP81_18755 [Variovorax sp.]
MKAALYALGCAALLAACAPMPSTAPVAPATRAAGSDCPVDAQSLPVQALYGTWSARFEGIAGTARVVLERHPEYEGVRGTITRGNGASTTVAQLAGDVDNDGLLTIDESQDGRSISGIWQGAPQAGACAREFRGMWRNTAEDRTHPFVLEKTGQWQ